MSKAKTVSTNLMAAAPALLSAARCALADLEGVMPEFEPDGDREHPGWQTIKELRKAITKAERSA
jgi:2-iminoacetate synthase ThiH